MAQTKTFKGWEDWEVLGASDRFIERKAFEGEKWDVVNFFRKTSIFGDKRKWVIKLERVD